MEMEYNQGKVNYIIETKMSLLKSANKWVFDRLKEIVDTVKNEHNISITAYEPAGVQSWIAEFGGILSVTVTNTEVKVFDYLDTDDNEGDLIYERTVEFNINKHSISEIAGYIALRLSQIDRLNKALSKNE